MQITSPKNIFSSFVAVLAYLATLSSAQAQDDLPAQAYAILQARCAECHGLEKKRGNLRMDSREALLKGGDSKEPALLSGNADDSLLIYLVESDDPKERMPSKADPLPAAEIAVLRAWIDAGAAWPADAALPADAGPHWAFQPIKKPSTPSTSSSTSIHNDIDRFLLAKIETAGLEPTPEADKHALIRRLYLELIGLPPTPEEVEAFVNDARPDAYEQTAQRLIGLPQYGERQARRWLDVARYADTNGYEKDRPRSIWAYRDWVINAFNADLPYDQFIIDQMAGDLLPNATEADKVATGFHRNSMFNEEGGIDAQEDWYKRTVDRANTTATAFLGLTMACAQCHDHKYDPISQHEYFAFAAFINDSGEAMLPLHDDAIEQKREVALAEIRDEEDQIVRSARKDPKIRKDFKAWLDKTTENASDWRVIRPESVQSAEGATMDLLDDGSVLATGDVPNDDTYTMEFDTSGFAATALRLEVLPHESLPGNGPGRGEILADGDFLLTGIHAEVIAGDAARPITIATATQDFAAENSEAAKALDESADTGWSIKGATGKPHAAVFEFATPLAANARVRLVLEQDFIHQQVIGCFRISLTSRPVPVVASGVPADIEAALIEDRDKTSVQHYYALHVAPGLAEQRKALDKERAALPKLPTTLVMSSREVPRTTHLYHRGEFLSPRDEIAPGVPAVLPPLPDDVPMNRLTLAQWIASRENPLTARVTMNRLWQQVFGRGLVGTVEDFGTRGDKPTHPELLDWLAATFMDSGWSYKTMHLMLVNSAAFRRSTNVTPPMLEKDPENLLLARAARPRLEAETIRDVALAASGLLNERVGGPSVYPPQPVGVAEVAYDGSPWPTSTGADRYRRGLYTYMKRTTPYAAGVTFDAPSGEEICPRRERTTTPLQALTLLNDRVYLEAAQALAKRVMESSDTDATRIERLYLLVLARTPDAGEIARITEFLTTTRAALNADATRARQIAGPIGVLSAEPSAELAAWTAVCRGVLNLDETVTRG